MWGTLRRFFDPNDGEQSLREQLEEAIAEHEDEQEGTAETSKGDLSPLEVTMLRNLLHFSEHDADDIAIPARRDHRGRGGSELGGAGSRRSSSMAIRACRSIARHSTR